MIPHQANSNLPGWSNDPVECYSENRPGQAPAKSGSPRRVPATDVPGEFLSADSEVLLERL